MDKQPPTPAQKRKLATLLLVTAFICIAAFLVTQLLAMSYGQWKGVSWFLNGDQQFTVRALLLSMVSGLIFGFVDNAGLFFGLDALDPFLPGGELTRAGLGNAFSNVAGSFLGAFAAKAIQVVYGFDGGPIYGNAVGMVVGCIAGIVVPCIITGKS